MDQRRSRGVHQVGSRTGLAAGLSVALAVLIGAGWNDELHPPLPSNAKAIFHFDLERLRQSDLYQEVEGRIGLFARSNEKLQVFLNATGLDDAAGVLRGFTLYSFADADDPQDFAGVVTSGFGAETRERLEKAYAPVARQLDDGQVIMPVIQTPEMEIVMAFLDADRLSFGTAGAVETIAGKDADNPGMLAAYKRTVTRRPIWGVINAQDVLRALTEDAVAPEGNSSPLQAFRDNPALRSIQSIGFSVELGRDIFFELRALTDSAENARLLADAVKGAVAMGQMGISQASDPDLLDFFRSVVAESERDSVYVSLVLTSAQIEKLRTGRDLFADLVPD